MTTLAELPEMGNQVNPATFGVVVIVLLQLAQFYFAWRKDQRAGSSEWEEELADLREELREEIAEVDGKLERMREASDLWRGEIHEKISGVAIQLSGVASTQELMNQTVVNLDRKIDALRAAH